MERLLLPQRRNHIKLDITVFPVKGTVKAFRKYGEIEVTIIAQISHGLQHIKDRFYCALS